ncbi:MAG: hypothetical protein NXH88_07190 [Hyphomonas sp.]|nr:hypothetical protein [Hyphomonas sp.]
MTALLFPIFNFVRDNTWAQVIVLLGFGFVILKARDKWRDRRTAQRVNARNEKKSRRVQARIEEKLDEKSTQTARARDDAPRGVTASDGVPDGLDSILFGNRGSG